MVANPLTVTVKGLEIIVSQPGNPSLQVIYRRDVGSRMLVAEDVIYDKAAKDPQFLAAAWHAAFDKAKSLGWL